jgi:hypothetical protein
MVATVKAAKAINLIIAFSQICDSSGQRIVTLKLAITKRLKEGTGPGMKRLPPANRHIPPHFRSVAVFTCDGMPTKITPT